MKALGQKGYALRKGLAHFRYDLFLGVTRLRTQLPVLMAMEYGGWVEMGETGKKSKNDIFPMWKKHQNLLSNTNDAHSITKYGSVLL